jgi:hypothetical protein
MHCLHWRLRMSLWAQAKVWLEWERAPSRWRSKHEGFADICLHLSTDRDSKPIPHGSRLPAQVANSPYRNRLMYFQFLPVAQKEPDSGFHTSQNHWKRREPEQWQPSSDRKLIIYSLLHAMPFSIQSTTILTLERDLYRFNLRTQGFLMIAIWKWIFPPPNRLWSWKSVCYNTQKQDKKYTELWDFTLQSNPKKPAMCLVLSAGVWLRR